MDDCPNCLAERRRFQAISVDLENAEVALRAERRKTKRLQAELDQQRKDEPEAADVIELMELWRDVVKAGDKRSKVDDPSGPRGQKVKWALKKFGKERCSNAIHGTPLDDWAMGRIRKSGGKTFNDIGKHILHDEETIERFEGLWLNRQHPQRKQPPRSADPPATIEEFASHIEGAKQVSDHQWGGRCPAHDDRQASLRFALGDRGLVVTCWAGCTPEQIAGAVGVPLHRWFYADDAPSPAPARRDPEPLPSAEQLQRWWTALAHHPKMLARLLELKGWTTETLGALGVGWDAHRKRLTIPVHGPDGGLVNVIRYVPGGTPKTLALRDRPRDLFPAPERCPDGQLWIVEGEPDAITGRELGLQSVGLPGVKGWRREWAQRFRDRDVVVCFDCDGPGREAARTVAGTLASVARSVRVVDLDQARNDGYDLTDAAHEGASADLLRALAEQTPPETEQQLPIAA